MAGISSAALTISGHVARYIKLRVTDNILSIG